MTEHKQDILSETGRHRAWIGERLNSAAAAPLRPNLIARELTRSPVGRAQPQSQAPKVSSRHAAITKGLQNFPSYKTWAEKAKSSWKDEKEE